MQDADAIVRVLQSVAGEDRWIRTQLPFDADVRARRIEERLRNGMAVSFVAETDTMAVGEASIVVQPDSALLGMGIIAGWRRRGIGRALLAAVEGYAFANRIARIDLQVYEHNPAARALYAGVGFVESGERSVEERGNGERWIIVPMSKRLGSTHAVTGLGTAPAIETPRLRLRPWRPDDYDAWARMNADPHVFEFLGPCRTHAEYVAQAERLAQRLEERGYGWWVAEVKQDGAFAGVIALQDVPFDVPFAPALEVGWRLAFDHWDRGYATEGARAAIDYAFSTLGRREVVAITAVVNVRSQRVMQRLGMIRDADGDFDHPLLTDDSPLRKHVLYRIDNEARPS